MVVDNLSVCHSVEFVLNNVPDGRFAYRKWLTEFVVYSLHYSWGLPHHTRWPQSVFVVTFTPVFITFHY